MGVDPESDPTVVVPTNLATPGMRADALLDRLRERQSRIREPSAHEGAGSGDHRLGPAPLPTTAEHLGRLLDSCFFATLLTDEGRPTRFACTYVSPEDVDGIPARRLARPLPLTPDAIRRISPASDPQLTSLGVHESAEGLCIWGLVDVPRLAALQVFGSDTGVIRVTYLRQTQMTHAHGIGHVRAGRDPSFLTSIQLIAAAMGLVRPQWYRPRALLGLADELIRAGHGGAILVSRRPRDEVVQGRITVTYPSLGPLTTLEEPVLEAQEANPAGSPDDELFQHFKSVERQSDIRRTARLGAVDGALLVDHHLRIIGFGAMIDVQGMRGPGQAYAVDLPAAMDLLRRRTPFDLARVSTKRTLTVDDLVGQRHRSAIRWASASETASLALVCSQDGIASLVAPIGRDGDVGVVMNIETSPDNW
jgi:sensor domain DACNV-containing protein